MKILNTLTNEYKTKFSSGLIIALLALSGLLILAPAIATVNAANASPGSVSTNYTWFASSASGTVHFTLSNPTSNTYSETELEVVVPSGWSITGATTGTLPTGATSSTTGQTVLFSGFSLPPGASAYGSITLTAPALVSTTAAPDSYTFIYKTSDSSASGALVSAGSTTFHVTGVTSLNVATSPSSGLTTLTAGTTITVTISVPSGTDGYTGLPLSFAEGGNTAYNASGLATLPSSATMSSSGSASITFMPDPVFNPAIGTTDYTGPETVTSTASTADGSITFSPTSVSFQVTKAASPSALSISPSTTQTETTLAAVAGSGITVSSTDAYGNKAPAPASGSGIPVTLTTVNLIGSRAGFAASTATYGSTYPYVPTGIAQSETVTIAAGASTASASAYAYFYDVDYGDTSYIVASASGLSSATSGHFVTYTFATSGGTTKPALPTGDSTVPIAAGKTVTVSYTLPTASIQANVPVYFDFTTGYTGATATAAGTACTTTVAYACYAGAFSNGGTQIEATTNSNGVATASLKVDTTEGDAIVVTAIPALSPTANFTTGVAVNEISTIAGTPSAYTLTVSYDNPQTSAQTLSAPAAAVNGSTLYIDVSITDAYGNLATNPGPGTIQITLAASAGLLSATTVYIPNGGTDLTSAGGQGLVYWVMPASIGTTATLKASGASLTPASFSVKTVSATPTMKVTSPKPLSGVIYSNSLAVVFGGYANASAGFGGTVNMATLGYKVGTGAWKTISLPASPNPTWSFAATMVSGLNTLSINVTDANSDVSTVQTFSVLVDTAAPTVTFSTANNANITSGSSVTAQVTDTLGDLNTTSLTATGTNLQTSATKTFTASVVGTNNPGHAVSYSVSISGMPTGNWSIVLTGSDYAGNTFTSKALTVHVTVPFAQSFVVSGTPHSATIGSFTGINASYTNLNPTSQSVVVFAVFKNSAGQTMGIGTGSLTVGAGATQSVFIAEPVGLASGTYSVSIFVFTTGNLPVSVSTSISVTV